MSEQDPRPGGPVRRYGSVVRLRPERREEYLRLHAAVRPGVEATLTHCNISNYTIFLHGDLLFGYFEYHGDDVEADLGAIADDEETRRWWTLTDPCQAPYETRAAGTWWADMTEIFHHD